MFDIKKTGQSDFIIIILLKTQNWKKKKKRRNLPLKNKPKWESGLESF